MRSPLQAAGANALLTAAYVIGAKLGLAVHAVAGVVTLVWPPSGIALAALVRYPWLWPGVAAGAFLANLWFGAPVATALGIAAGNTLEAVIGAAALRRIPGFSSELERPRDVAALVILGGLFAPLVSATFGTASIHLGGLVSPGGFGEAWRAWWLGDAISVLVITPLLSTAAWPRRPSRRWLEAFMLLLLFVGAGYAEFGGAQRLEWVLSRAYVLFPPLAWAALRFGVPGAARAVFAVSALAIAATVAGTGPFVRPELHEGLLALQVFMVMSAVTFLFVGAVSSERVRAVEELRRIQDDLEQRIAARTSDLVRSAAELGEARGHLELRVEQRTAELQQVARELEEAVRTRDTFLSIASHELRTPLSALHLQIGMLVRKLRRGGEVGGPVMLEKLDIVNRQVERLSTLIDNLLDVSRITAGRLQIELAEVDLSAVAREVVARHEEQLRSAGCTLVLHAEAPLRGVWDAMRLEQIVSNLLANAIKYGAGKPIEITVEGDDSWARLTVRDEGMGIAPEHQARIFERFERLVSEKHFGGLGLGLWIVRQIVEALGGRIEVESALGQGARFTVALPRRRGEPRPAARGSRR